VIGAALNDDITGFEMHLLVVQQQLDQSPAQVATPTFFGAVNGPISASLTFQASNATSVRKPIAAGTA